MTINLLHGDCLELMKTIPDGSVDLILTDPPYGTTACKWDSVIDFDLMWQQLKRIIKPNGAIVLFGSEPFSSALRMSNIKQYKYDWVWDKRTISNPMLAKYQPLKQHEIISVFSKKTHVYQPIKTETHIVRSWKQGKQNPDAAAPATIGATGVSVGKYPKTILSFKSAKLEGRVFHPTQKPVVLLEYLIKTYTQENETVLDFTMGSGSTGVACVNTNRSFIGIEMDDKYFDIAKDRITTHQ